MEKGREKQVPAGMKNLLKAMNKPEEDEKTVRAFLIGILMQLFTPLGVSQTDVQNLYAQLVQE